MSLHLAEVISQKELKQFIKFPFRLYKDNPYYVPPLISFELGSLDPRKNPSFEHAKARYWVVKKEDEIVGRIACIIVDPELKEEKLARFGWMDFIDDLEVSKLLFETAVSWAKSEGATAIHGPLGFSDMDFEGALTEGFEILATQVALYNYAYYIDHFEALGLSKTATWVEIRSKVPEKTPDRIKRAIPLIKEKYNVQVKKFKSTKELKKYVPEVFNVINESYSHLYGYHALTQKQIDYYIELYFGFVKKEYFTIVVNQKDEVVGFAVTLPSLSTALQKAKGYLYPFGFIHILKSFFFSDTVDMLLIGVRPDYQKSGINTFLVDELTTIYNKNGIKHLASGPMLENNNNVLQFFKGSIEDIGTVKRSCFRKAI